MSSQTFEHAKEIPRENNLQNVIALDPETDQFSILTPEPNKKDPHQLF